MDDKDIEQKIKKIAETTKYHASRDLGEAAINEMRKRQKKPHLRKKFWMSAIACALLIAIAVPVSVVFFKNKNKDTGFGANAGELVMDSVYYENMADYNSHFSTSFLGLGAASDRQQQAVVCKYSVSQAVAWVEENTTVDTEERYSFLSLYAVLTKESIPRFEEMAVLCKKTYEYNGTVLQYSHEFNEEDLLYEGNAMWTYENVKYYMYQFSIDENDFMNTLQELLA